LDSAKAQLTLVVVPDSFDCKLQCVDERNAALQQLDTANLHERYYAVVADRCYARLFTVASSSTSMAGYALMPCGTNATKSSSTSLIDFVVQQHSDTLLLLRDMLGLCQRLLLSCSYQASGVLSC
jgi:hypothetical protein